MSPAAYALPRMHIMTIAAITTSALRVGPAIVRFMIVIAASEAVDQFVKEFVQVLTKSWDETSSRSVLH